jgi:photosystem II stability/assembly factor-like uncharacterized protein
MTRLVSITSIALTATLALTACGTQATGGGQPAGGAPPHAAAPQVGGAQAPLDAALVTPDFGWVLTADRLLISRDGGTTFSDVTVPVPASQARAAFFSDARHGYVAAPTGPTITAARTSDGGRTWQAGTLVDATAPAAQYGPLRLSFGDQTHGVILAQTPTSGAVSAPARLFATADGGRSWSAGSAPVAGEITMEPGGKIWLAGGVVGDELHSSSDQGRHWNNAKVQLTGAAAETRAIAPPHDGVLPVTVVTENDETDVALLTTADQGRTWRETNRVPVHGRTGPGVRVPVAMTGTGAQAAPLVVDTAGEHAYRAAPRRAATTAATTAATAPDMRPAGLPEGVHTVSFATDGRTGWALATYGRCANGKADCTLYSPLLSTTDGGATWRQIGLWQKKLN